jgi:LysM repeat protein
MVVRRTDRPQQRVTTAAGDPKPGVEQAAEDQQTSKVRDTTKASSTGTGQSAATKVLTRAATEKKADPRSSGSVAGALIDRKIREKVVQARKKAAARTGTSTPSEALSRPSGKKHTVAEGDTLSEIARNHGTSLLDLITVNPGVRFANLQPGQQIDLPRERQGLSPRGSDGQLVDLARETNTFEEVHCQREETGVERREPSDKGPEAVARAQDIQGRRSSTGIPEPFPTDLLGQALKLFEAAGWGHDSRERAAWIIDNGNGSYRLERWPWSAEERKETWKGPPPPGAVGILHTHPNKADKNPSTATGPNAKSDKKTANEIHMPVYVLHRDGLRKIEPRRDKPDLVELHWLKNAQTLEKLREKREELRRHELQLEGETRPAKVNKHRKKIEKLTKEIQELDQDVATMDRS